MNLRALLTAFFTVLCCPLLLRIWLWVFPHIFSGVCHLCCNGWFRWSWQLHTLGYWLDSDCRTSYGCKLQIQQGPMVANPSEHTPTVWRTPAHPHHNNLEPKYFIGKLWLRIWYRIHCECVPESSNLLSSSGESRMLLSAEWQHRSLCACVTTLLVWASSASADQALSETTAITMLT